MCCRRLGVSVNSYDITSCSRLRAQERSDMFQPGGRGWTLQVWVGPPAGPPPTAGLRSSSDRRLAPPPLEVAVVHVQEHVPARDPRVELGADEEGAGHLPVEGVGLLGRGGEAVAQHDGDEALDALRRALDAKVEGLGRGEGLPQDHHRLHVGVLEGLTHDRRVTGCSLGGPTGPTEPPTVNKLSPWLRSLSGISDPSIWRERWLGRPRTPRAPPGTEQCVSGL